MHKLGTETGQELASTEWRDWDRTGKGIFLNARDGKFLGFLREKSGSREMAFGNADLYYIFDLMVFYRPFDFGLKTPPQLFLKGVTWKHFKKFVARLTNSLTLSLWDDVAQEGIAISRPVFSYLKIKEKT